MQRRLSPRATTPARTFGVGVAVALLLGAAPGAGTANARQPARPPEAAVRYHTASDYLGWARTPSVVHPPTVVLDHAGIPRVRYGDVYRYNPVTIAQYGLREFSLAVDRSPGARARSLHERRAVIAADWLVAHQDRRTGVWWERFAFSKFGLHNPWASALAQGNAMSLLTRIYRVTGKRDYLDAAVRGLRPLQIPVSRGGLRTVFLGHPFYEEYPTRPASLVLNGFMFTLLGLYDVARLAPHSAAHELYTSGVRSLLALLPYYDTPDGTSQYYSLLHLTDPPRAPQLASAHYTPIVVELVAALDSIAPHRTLAYYRDRWAAGLPR